MLVMRVRDAADARRVRAPVRAQNSAKTDNSVARERTSQALARCKPTFQWIEPRRMDCFGTHLDPTPATLRAETWFAIAGGAHAIGYIPNNWSPEVGAEIARTNDEIQTLVPALVEPNIAASVSIGSYVKVGAREHNGAAYVIAVNASRTSTTATITVPAGDTPAQPIQGRKCQKILTRDSSQRPAAARIDA
jgi:hypothetical protein